MKYNTESKRLILPEYGRHIQTMVDHCVTITDTTERRHCADTIINIMGNMFPHLRDVNDFKHILWDHLAIMSNFNLDIEYPYPVIKKEDLRPALPKVPYSHVPIKYRHYGHALERMIAKADEMEEGKAKDQLVRMLATYMKKSFLAWNKDSVDDRKIFADLRELSHGKIDWSEENHRLMETRELITKNNNGRKNHTRKGR